MLFFTGKPQAGDLEGFRHPLRMMKEGWHVARTTFPTGCSALVVSVRGYQQTAFTFPGCAAGIFFPCSIRPGSTACASETCGLN